MAALCSIDAQLDLGKNLTVPAFKDLITETKNKMERYNALLSNADAARTEFQEAEQKLADWTERMLKGVATLYGRNSAEYEKAGGVRKSEIRRSPRKVTKIAA